MMPDDDRAGRLGECTAHDREIGGAGRSTPGQRAFQKAAA